MNLPDNTGDTGLILESEDLLEKEIATYSSILVWEISWTEKPGKQQSMGLQSQKKLSNQAAATSSVYMSILLSEYIHPPSSTVSISLFSKSALLFLPCKYIHQYHFSRCHIYALIYDICFSLSDLTHSV